MLQNIRVPVPGVIVSKLLKENKQRVGVKLPPYPDKGLRVECKRDIPINIVFLIKVDRGEYYPFPWQVKSFYFPKCFDMYV